MLAGLHEALDPLVGSIPLQLWDWELMVRVFDLPQSAFASALTRAGEYLIHRAGDLEVVIADRELYMKVLDLPLAAIKHLLKSPETRVASENTAYVLARRWCELKKKPWTNEWRDPDREHYAEDFREDWRDSWDGMEELLEHREADGASKELVQLIRVPHMTRSFLMSELHRKSCMFHSLYTALDIWMFVEFKDDVDREYMLDRYLYTPM
jgi:hypothetical protein